jgi:hypothetical protein
MDSFKGFDDLHETLTGAGQALESLDGELAALSVDTSNPKLTIAEMERIVDAKFGPNRDNPLVEVVTRLLKEKYKDSILQKVEDARKNANVAKDYTNLPVGTKIDGREIQVCPCCGRRGLRTETYGVPFYTHRYGMTSDGHGAAELIDDTCRGAQENRESAESK